MNNGHDSLNDDGAISHLAVCAITLNRSIGGNGFKVSWDININININICSMKRNEMTKTKI
jgi:hypothetical protein